MRQDLEGDPSESVHVSAEEMARMMALHEAGNTPETLVGSSGADEAARQAEIARAVAQVEAEEREAEIARKAAEVQQGLHTVGVGDPDTQAYEQTARQAPQHDAAMETAVLPPAKPSVMRRIAKKIDGWMERLGM